MQRVARRSSRRPLQVLRWCSLRARLSRTGHERESRRTRPDRTRCNLSKLLRGKHLGSSIQDAMCWNREAQVRRGEKSGCHRSTVTNFQDCRCCCRQGGRPQNPFGLSKRIGRSHLGCSTVWSGLILICPAGSVRKMRACERISRPIDPIG